MFGLFIPKGIFRYALLPGVAPRIHNLFMSGFGYIPFFIAVVYQMVGLLPAQHPYLRQSNIGHFGIRHVVAQAAGNIKFSLKHIDQIVLFIAVLAGLVIFLIQFIAIGAMFFFQPASAMPTDWGGFFTIQNVGNRQQDLANIMLDMVFGVPHSSGVGGFFESCIGLDVVCQDNFGDDIVDIDLSAAGAGSMDARLFGPLSTEAYTIFPFPYHLGIHRLFSIYSTGLLVVAVFMMMYFIATILAETMQTGTPFGKRFNKTWAPLRVVIAFGLLMPLTVGLNSSQYVVLYAAKYGSAFATNGWRYFNDTLTANYLTDGEQLVSVPNTPELLEISRFLYVAKVCKYIYNQHLESKKGSPLTQDEQVQAYALGEHSDTANSSLMLTSGTTYDDMIDILPPETTVASIRFGVKDETKYAKERGKVSPICGEVQLIFSDQGKKPGTASASERDAEPGPYRMQAAYYNMLHSMWHTTATIFSAIPNSSKYRDIAFARDATKLPVDPAHDIMLDANFIQAVNDEAEKYADSEVAQAVSEQIASSTWGTAPLSGSPLYSKGWAAAGIWYNRIAEMNGAVTASVYAIPTVSKFPEVMERISKIKEQYDKSINPDERFKPEVNAVDNTGALMPEVIDGQFATVLYKAFKDWSAGVGYQSMRPSDNPFLSFISSIFGTEGLYNMRKNPSTHPLAMLSGIGRSLVESSIQSLGYAAIAVGLGQGILPPALASVSASFFIMAATLGLTIGVLLFYVIPFLPFIYFFFAVGGWIKGIFEAMVGAPLWALAHIRIDGHGMPGNAALNGYFLIFEVFLRPILIVFGLLASVVIFSALVSVLNSIFTLVTENTAGYDIEAEMTASSGTLRYMRSLIDEFFFTVIYAIIVYLIGVSSFKLIDTIPNNILRWMGQSVASFGDQREDPTQGLVSRASVGSQQVLSKIGGGLQAGASALTKK